MSQTTEQIIERLRAIGSKDREWLLCSLSAEERRRVLMALMGQSAEPASGSDAVAVNGNGKDHSVEPASVSHRLDPRLAVLMDASAENIAEILADESDWTIVVLLEFNHWPWSEDFLRLLTSARVQTLREMSEHVSKTVKPKVGEALALLVASRLQRHAPQNANRSMFDMALERAQNQTPATIDKGVGE